MEKITPVNYDNDQPQKSELSHEAKQWALWCHLSVLAGYIIPLGNLIGPLVIWQTKKDEIPGMDEHGKEVVNYQLSFTIYYMISFVLMIVIIGIFALVVFGLMSLIFTIIGAVQAEKGHLYRYPMTIRFIK